MPAQSLIHSVNTNIQLEQCSVIVVVVSVNIPEVIWSNAAELAILGRIIVLVCSGYPTLEVSKVDCKTVS